MPLTLLGIETSCDETAAAVVARTGGSLSDAEQAAAAVRGRTHVLAMLDFQAKGSIVFDYGNNIRQRAYDAGVKDAFSYPGFVPA